MLVYFFKLQRITEPLNEYAQLEEMLALRAMGWSYGALADKFKVDKLTVRYLCRKFGLSEETVKATIFRQSTRATPQPLKIDHNRINPGKTYAEYLRDEQLRKQRRMLENTLKNG